MMNWICEKRKLCLCAGCKLCLRAGCSLFVKNFVCTNVVIAYDLGCSVSDRFLNQPSAAQCLLENSLQILSFCVTVVSFELQLLLGRRRPRLYDYDDDDDYDYDYDYDDYYY